MHFAGLVDLQYIYYRDSPPRVKFLAQRHSDRETQSCHESLFLGFEQPCSYCTTTIRVVNLL